MISTGDAISLALQKVNTGSATVLTDAGQRAKAYQELVRCCKFTHKMAPVWWRLDPGSHTLAILANTGITTLPANFHEFGREANVWITPGQFGIQFFPPLQWKSPQELTAYQRVTQYPTQYPLVYTLLGETAAGLKQMQTYPISQFNVNVDVTGYVTRCPDLLDFPAPPAVAIQGAGGLTGTYQWGTTYVNALGETEVGPLSPPLVLAAQQVTVTPASSLSRSVTQRNIYRTKAVTAGALPVYLSGNIANNLPWATYLDNVADASLTTIGPVASQSISGLEQFAEDWQEQLIVDGVVAMLRDMQGDTRARDGAKPTSWELFEKNVIRMWANEKQGQNKPRMTPRYAGARRSFYPGRRRIWVLPN